LKIKRHLLIVPGGVDGMRYPIEYRSSCLKLALIIYPLQPKITPGGFV